MEKKRTIEDIQKDIDKLHKKAMEKRAKLLKKIGVINFKIQILDKIYQEEIDRLEQEQITITKDEFKEELDL